MMSTAALLFLIASSQFLLSVQGLTLRLKGKEIFQSKGARSVITTELPVGGCRRYDTLECLSDVKYRGRVEKSYWVYTDPNTFKTVRVDSIHCMNADRCKNPEIGWQSSKGIYKNGGSYFAVVRLGRNATNPAVGLFTCHVEGDSNSPITVEIINPPTIDPTTTDPPTTDPTTTRPTIPDPTTTTDPSTTTDPNHISWIVLPPTP